MVKGGGEVCMAGVALQRRTQAGGGCNRRHRQNLNEETVGSDRQMSSNQALWIEGCATIKLQLE